MVDYSETNIWVVYRNFRQLYLKVGKNSLVEYSLTIFGGNNQVVLTMIDAM